MTTEQVASLLPLIHQLPATRQDFARDLCAKFARHGHLSTKQVYWIDRLTAEAAGDVVKSEERVESLDSVIALFDRVVAGKLKWPKITLDASAVGVPLMLSRAGPTAKQPGSVNLTDGGTYGTNIWYGRIERDGTFVPSRDCPATLVEFLGRLGTDTANVIADYGRKTGRCACCNLPLTDARSAYVGYGATCAKHYQLPYPKMSEVKAAAAGQRDLLEDRAEDIAFARLEREQEERGFRSDPDQIAA